MKLCIERHVFAFGRALFPDLRALHGDKAVWKLREQRAAEVAEVAGSTIVRAMGASFVVTQPT